VQSDEGERGRRGGNIWSDLRGMSKKQMREKEKF